MVAVPSALMEADPGLPCEEANAVDEPQGEGGGNALTRIPAMPPMTKRYAFTTPGLKQLLDLCFLQHILESSHWASQKKPRT